MSDPVTRQLQVTNLEHAFARRSAGVGSTVPFVKAILAGSMLGELLPETGERLDSYIDYTVLFLIGLLMFEIRFTRIWENG